MSEAPWNVLFLDDSPAALDAVERALVGGACQVRTATTLSEALQAVPTSDLVVVDFHMPGMNGAEALKRMKAHVLGAPAVPVFYLYTTDTEVAASFRKHGFDGAFTDKGNVRTLVSQLSSALRLLKMRRYMSGRRDG